MKLKPATEALAFRIWAYAHPLGWNCTIMDVAEALEVHPNRVNGTCVAKGWLRRFRASGAEVARSASQDSPSNGSANGYAFGTTPTEKVGGVGEWGLDA